MAPILAKERKRRDDLLFLADRQQPAPGFGPLPTAEDTTIPVYGCADHAITLDLAARIHQAGCTAPNPEHLNDCDCQAEPPAEPTPHPDTVESSRLPAHWRAGA